VLEINIPFLSLVLETNKLDNLRETTFFHQLINSEKCFKANLAIY